MASSSFVKCQNKSVIEISESDSDDNDLIESSIYGNTPGYCIVPSSEDSVYEDSIVVSKKKAVTYVLSDSDTEVEEEDNDSAHTEYLHPRNKILSNIIVTPDQHCIAPSSENSISEDRIAGSKKENAYVLSDGETEVDDEENDSADTEDLHPRNKILSNINVTPNQGSEKNVKELISPELNSDQKIDTSPVISCLNTSRFKENPADGKGLTPSIHVMSSFNNVYDSLEGHSTHEVNYEQEPCKSNNYSLIDNDAEENKENLLSEVMRLEYEINEVTESIKNKITTLKTINLDGLPDKGTKLKVSVHHEERNLENLYEQLNRAKCKLEFNKNTSNRTVDVMKEEPPKFGVLPSVDLQNMGRKALETHRVQQALTIDSLRHLHSSLNTCPSENEIVQDPTGLKVTLMTHQKHALAWMAWRENEKPAGGILADDMGLGKTLTMISHVLKQNQESADESSSENDENDDDDDFRERSKYKGGTLVICPASVIGQWESEIKEKVKRGLLVYDIYHGNNREKKPRRLAKLDILITSYNIVRVEFQNSSEVDKKTGPLFSVNWKRIILDEAHEIRNHKCKKAQAIFNLKGRHRWALTGTPVHNKTQDFYSLVRYLRCKPFNDLNVWKKWVEAKDESGSKRLNMLTRSLMLRRTKDLLISDGMMEPLPEKLSETIMINLGENEMALYEEVANFSKTLLAQLLCQKAEKEHLLEYGIPVKKITSHISEKDNPFREHPGLNRLYQRVVTSNNVKTHEILVLLLRLRQICCHPTLMKSMIEKDAVINDGIEDEIGSDVDLLEKMSTMAINDNEKTSEEEEDEFETTKRNVFSLNNPIFKPNWRSSKIMAILQLLEEKLLKTDDKIVIVSQWSSMLDLIYNFLKDFKNCKCERLTGKVPVDQRMDIVSNFNRTSSSLKVLLLSLTAGGTGLNLIGGNHLILTDPHWNPQLEAQACDRIYRIGQNKAVKIYKFICAETIEERIQLLQKDKLALADGVLTGAKQLQVAKLTLNDMKMLFNVN